MRIYVCKVFGKEVVQEATNWANCQSILKTKYPTARYIGYVKSVAKYPSPDAAYNSIDDGGDFDDAGKIGKDSYEWRNRHRNSQPSRSWGYRR